MRIYTLCVLLVTTGLCWVDYATMQTMRCHYQAAAECGQ